MSQSLTLYRLQQIDTSIERIRVRMDNIQRTLEDNSEVSALVRLAETSAAKLQETETLRDLAEAELHALRIKIEQTESSLYGGKGHSPKELQDLQNESVALKRHRLVLEDKLLELMIATESAQEANIAAQAAASTTQALWSAQNSNLVQEKHNLLKELQKSQDERKAITGTLAASQVDLYEQIRQLRHGIAVTSILENSCGACGTSLTLAQIQASRSASQMERCPTCGRILYGS